jgi:hypothetical protein
MSPAARPGRGQVRGLMADVSDKASKEVSLEDDSPCPAGRRTLTVLCAPLIRRVARTGMSVVSAGPQYSTTEVHAAKPAPGRADGSTNLQGAADDTGNASKLCGILPQHDAATS